MVIMFRCFPSIIENLLLFYDFFVLKNLLEVPPLFEFSNGKEKFHESIVINCL